MAVARSRPGRRSWQSGRPPAQRASTGEPGQPLPGVKEGVLKCILGVMARSEDAIAVREQRRSVGFDEATKRVLVAVVSRFK